MQCISLKYFVEFCENVFHSIFQDKYTSEYKNTATFPYHVLPLASG